MRISQRQPDNKFRAAVPAFTTVDIDGPMMKFHQFFSNGQANAGTFLMMFMGGVGLVKTVENIG